MLDLSRGHGLCHELPLSFRFAMFGRRAIAFAVVTVGGHPGGGKWGPRERPVSRVPVAHGDCRRAERSRRGRGEFRGGIRCGGRRFGVRGSRDVVSARGGRLGRPRARAGRGLPAQLVSEDARRHRPELLGSPARPAAVSSTCGRSPTRHRRSAGLGVGRSSTPTCSSARTRTGSRPRSTVGPAVAGDAGRARAPLRGGREDPGAQVFPMDVAPYSWSARPRACRDAPPAPSATRPPRGTGSIPHVSSGSCLRWR